MSSGITGRAVIDFGGKINILIGYDDVTKVGGIKFEELTEQFEVGEKVKKGTPTYGTQVVMHFDNLESIGILRDALDALERAFKDGKLEIGDAD